MASQHPKLKMILAHWGGGLPFFEQNPRIRKILANVAYDCAASPLMYEPEIFRRMIDLVGIEKLIFGSDYPLRIYPKTQKTADFSTYTKAIQTRAGLNPDEATALFAKNVEARLS
jgi:predicted TIM-barrel fold metal-dependent hydrolase